MSPEYYEGTYSHYGSYPGYRLSSISTDTDYPGDTKEQAYKFTMPRSVKLFLGMSCLISGTVSIITLTMMTIL